MKAGKAETYNRMLEGVISPDSQGGIECWIMNEKKKRREIDE